MELGLTLSGTLLALGFFAALVGLPVLPDRLRRRREEAIGRQIALTDALDAALGPIVAPVVRRPLWGPWRVELAAPLADPAVLGRILAVTQAVFSAPGPAPGPRYRILLALRPEPSPTRRPPRVACSSRTAAAA